MSGAATKRPSTRFLSAPGTCKKLDDGISCKMNGCSWRTQSFARPHPAPKQPLTSVGFGEIKRGRGSGELEESSVTVPA